MSMTTDASHQALDINIGRILEMFLKGEIARDKAETDLAVFYKGKHRNVAASDVRAYLAAQLDQAEACAAKVRTNLVQMAALARSGRSEFDTRLHRSLH